MKNPPLSRDLSLFPSVLPLLFKGKEDLIVQRKSLNQTLRCMKTLMHFASMYLKYLNDTSALKESKRSSSH